MNTGIYCLILKLDNNKEIIIGKKGKHLFEKGYYIYVGSALNNLEKRIARHIRNEKKKHWHIDYLLEHAKITDVIKIHTDKKIECILSKNIERLNPKTNMPGFGSSDCRCKTHLHHFNQDPMIDKQFKAIFKSPQFIKCLIKHQKTM